LLYGWEDNDVLEGGLDGDRLFSHGADDALVAGRGVGEEHQDALGVGVARPSSELEDNTFFDLLLDADGLFVGMEDDGVFEVDDELFRSGNRRQEQE